MSNIQHELTGSGGRFFIEKEGRETSEMTYSKTNEKL
jgi:hypothetical protein